MITDIISQLTRDEGIRLYPYLDTVGRTTIGIGRNLTDVGISTDEADYLLANDIARAKANLEEALPWTSGLDSARQGALINMAFNLGIGGLMGFRNFLSAMQVGDWATAATEMLQSKWATQVRARAQRLSKQVETGEWQ